MGSPNVALCAGLLAAIAFAPTAHAQDRGVWVTPSSPAPGGDVALRVSGCTEKTATAVSDAFVADVRLTVADGVLVGESRVRSALTAGTYDVKVDCGGSDREIPLTVVKKPTHPTRQPTSPASPIAPVHAGGGGTADLAAADDARETGPGTGQAVTGLVLAGVAAVAVVLRGSRRRRSTG
jgi:hypothetical protein